MNFAEYYLLSEQMTSSDIIDTYILMSLPDIDDPATAFIKKEIMDQARSNILTELNSIIHGELKHVRDTGNLDLLKLALENIIDDKKDGVDFSDIRDPDTVEQVHVLCMALKLPLPDYNYIVTYPRFYIRKLNELYRLIRKKELPMRAAYICFKHLNWESLYGGENWARITLHVMKLLETKSPTEFFKALDRLIDFVHNTGTILNKFKGYKEGWIQFILDLKEKAVNIRELIPYASPEVRKMFGSQEWRMFMKKVPGQGAETSIDSYKTLFSNYLEKIASLNEAAADETAEAEVEIIRYWSAISQVISRINKHLVNEILKDIDLNTAVRARETINLFYSVYYTGQIDKNMKKFKKILDDYVDKNYSKLYSV